MKVRYWMHFSSSSRSFVFPIYFELKLIKAHVFPILTFFTLITFPSQQYIMDFGFTQSESGFVLQNPSWFWIYHLSEKGMLFYMYIVIDHQSILTASSFPTNSGNPGPDSKPDGESQIAYSFSILHLTLNSLK